MWQTDAQMGYNSIIYKYMGDEEAYMKIRTKVSTYYVIVFVLSVFLIGVIVLHLFKTYIIQNTITRLSDQVYANSDIFIPSSNWDNANVYIENYAENIAINLSKNNLHVRIYNRDKLLKDASSGVILEYSFELSNLNDAVISSLEGKNAYFIENDILHYAVPIRYEDSVVGVVEYIYPLSAEENTIAFFKRIFFISSIASVLIMILLSIFISARITDPLNVLTDAAQQFSEGNFKKVEIDTKDEIASLTDTFNDMAETINNHIDNINMEKAKLDMVLSNLNEGIVAIDYMGNILFKNIRAIQIIGGGIPEDLKFLIDKAFESGQIIKDLHINKRIIRADITLNNDICIIILRDITKDRELEEKQKKFISNASHELKTPVTAIIGYTEMLKEDKEYDETIVEYIYGESKRLKDLVIELLELSRLESIEKSIDKTTVNIGHMVKDVIQNMASKSSKFNIVINSSIEDEIVILADNSKIRQVVINLIDNAIKYSDPGQAIDVTLKKEGRFSVLSVRDYGKGIPKDEMDKVFDRFFRCSNSYQIYGSGLGLAISKEIVEKHGGTIEIEKDIDKGSKFTVMLPMD